MVIIKWGWTLWFNSAYIEFLGVAKNPLAIYMHFLKLFLSHPAGGLLTTHDTRRGTIYSIVLGVLLLGQFVIRYMGRTYFYRRSVDVRRCKVANCRCPQQQHARIPQRTRSRRTKRNGTRTHRISDEPVVCSVYRDRPTKMRELTRLGV